MDGRKPFDLAGEIRRATTGPCFICEMLAGRPGYFHHVVAQDDDAVIFLSRYPTQRGYCLVAPRAHVEDLADGSPATPTWACSDGCMTCRAP